MKKNNKKEKVKSANNPPLSKIRLKSADEVSEFAENIINTVREPLLVLDKELRVVKASRSFFDFFKVSSDETIGTLIYDLGNHQWNIPKLRELLETILPEKTTFDNYEVEHNFSTIGKRVMLLNARQIERAFGKEKIILLAIEDITERKGIETGLEKTRKELVVIKKSADEVSEFSENIINTVREPLLVLDQELRVIKASHSFYDFFKVSPEETVGQLIYDLGNKQWDIPKLRELLETILPEKTTFNNYEVEHDFSAIGKRIMLLNARQVERAFGKEKIILFAIEDITERKQAEEELGRFYEVSVEMMCIIGFDGCFKRLNPAWEKNLGFSLNKMLFEPFIDFVHPEDKDATLAEAAKLTTGTKTINFENRYSCTDGAYRWLSWSVIPAVEEELLYCVARDVTERKQAEEEIRQLNADLEHRVVVRTAQLEASNKELEAFTYSVSHDLRAPLRHISGYVELLTSRFHSTLSEKGQHYLDSIADSVHQMGLLIDNLLQFSRTGRAEIRRADSDMNGIVKEIIESLDKDNPDRSIEWTVAKLPSVYCDSAMMRLVWMNLLSNAVKFTRTREKTLIEIGVKVETKEVIFFVRDNGVGFDMQYAQKLFGVFQRLHSMEEFEGTGIGLANVRRIIMRHGGRTWAEAELDKGATFYFSI